MGKIVISTNTTLDGVVEDPDGGEGTARGGWFSPPGSADREAWAAIEFAEAQSTEALLLGRRSYEWFAHRWASRTGAWADRLNGMPKYVVSATLTDPDWPNTTVLRGDPVAEVTRLRDATDGDVAVYGSYQLGRTLLEHDLVDELRLFVFPVVAGGGARLFGTTGAARSLRLVSARVVGENLAFLVHGRHRAPSPDAT